LGFEDLSKFIIHVTRGAWPFRWLQSLENPNICLLSIDPELIAPNYKEFLISKISDYRVLDNTDSLDLIVPVIIPPGYPDKASVNLKAPIVIDTQTNLAHQVVLGNSDYKINHSIFGTIL